MRAHSLEGTFPVKILCLWRWFNFKSNLKMNVDWVPDCVCVGASLMPVWRSVSMCIMMGCDSLSMRAHVSVFICLWELGSKNWKFCRRISGRVAVPQYNSRHRFTQQSPLIAPQCTFANWAANKRSGHNEFYRSLLLISLPVKSGHTEISNLFSENKNAIFPLPPATRF